MSTSVLCDPLELEEVRYRSVVDAELRAHVLADPAGFGLDVATLPAPVEAQDPGLLDLSSFSVFAAECQSTCSSGPITIICDGTTK